MKLFFIKNTKGQYYRSKGYGGHGMNWVDDFSKAKIFAREGGAKAVISWWVNHSVSTDTPFLVKLTIQAHDQEIIPTDVKAIRARFLKKEIARIKRKVKFWPSNENYVKTCEAEVAALYKQLDTYLS